MTKENLNTEESGYIYLIYQTFIDPSKKTPEQAIIQALIRATLDKRVAYSYCKNSPVLTVEDCWAIAFAEGAVLKEFNCQTIPLDREIKIKGLEYE